MGSQRVRHDRAQYSTSAGLVSLEEMVKTFNQESSKILLLEAEKLRKFFLGFSFFFFYPFVLLVGEVLIE